MRRTNLFELLGRPVAAAGSDSGTQYTASPETFDDAGLLPSIADCGTLHTRDAMETYDDDSMLPSVADYGTVNSRADWATFASGGGPRPPVSRGVPARGSDACDDRVLGPSGDKASSGRRRRHQASHNRHVRRLNS